MDTGKDNPETIYTFPYPFDSHDGKLDLHTVTSQYFILK